MLWFIPNLENCYNLDGLNLVEFLLSLFLGEFTLTIVFRKLPTVELVLLNLIALTLVKLNSFNSC